MTRRRVLVALATVLATLAAPLASSSAAGLAASTTSCPGQSRLDASPAAQAQAMLCMTNFARARLGQPPLEEATALATSATEKTADILSCDSFSHFACGREFSYW